MMTDRLAEIEARLDAATPGPWKQDQEIDGGYAGMMTVVRVPDWWRIMSVGQARVHDRHHAEANAALIAAAPTDLHDLVAVAKAARRVADYPDWQAFGALRDALADLEGGAS